MHNYNNKQSPVLTDRSLLMRDLVLLQRSRSLRDPSARLHESFTQKYTPRTFRDLVGQSLVVQALSNAVTKRRVGLLYVFHGPNGTGKTSCARVFARALNCHSTEQRKPCGVCSLCVSCKNRNIREMGPVKSFDDFENLIISQEKKKKHHLVFILDDCDAMSTDCWNALSKFVDRAPTRRRRVVFVLVCSSLKVTWLTAALLQLAPDQRSLVPPIPCNNEAAAETSKTRPSVEDIWLAVIENVRVNGLRELLYREGKIFSISIGSDPTVELMFNSPVTKLMAENFRDHILRAFEAVLGSPVTVAIRIESKKDMKNSSERRSEIIELDDGTESARRKDLDQVVMQAEGNGWLIADKLEHENLRLESISRSLICWKVSRSVRRKVSRLKKVRRRRARVHSL